MCVFFYDYVECVLWHVARVLFHVHSFFIIPHLTNELYRWWNIVNRWGDSD